MHGHFFLCRRLSVIALHRINHIAATVKDVAASWEMLLSRLPFSFPGSAAGKIVSALSISNGSGTAPYRNGAAASNPPGDGFGKFHFDFSMLVFSADFPADTKSRWKRTKTVGTAKQRHKDAKILPRAFCWNTMQPVNCIPGSCVLLLVMIVLYFVLSPVWLFNFQILHSMTKNDVDQLVA